MTTIKDIAIKANVSPSTVSRALKMDPRIPYDTRERILIIAKELNYRPNKFARNLVSKNLPDQTIGIVFPELVHRYFFEILRGVDESLEATNYNLMIFNIHKRRGDVFKRIYSESLAGLIIMGFSLSDEEKRSLDLFDIPFVYLDIIDNESSYITCDNFYGGKLVGEYFRSKNCSKLCYIGVDEVSELQKNRLSGFESVISGENIRLIKHFIKKDEKISEEFTFKLIEEDPYIEGIFYFCDELAYGGLSALKRSGSMIHIVGYDDLYPSHFLPLTTVKQPAKEIGFKGGKIILEIIENKSENKRIILKPELVKR